jgi:TPR repeat protein
MKENRLVVFTVLLLLSAAVFQLPAQQNEAHRKSSADISSKAETSDAEWVKSYRKAAEQNDAIAQFNLAFAYANGRGVAKDDAEAVKWYRRAAEQNLAQAQYNLGFAYANGRGVAKNYAQAVKWLRKAADQSNVQAETALGYCYATGQGVAKEHTEAAKWYRKAAEQNFAQAELNLGNCYANGQGVAKDDAEAVKWYRKAAEQDFAQAQISLALSYALGQGVAKDYVESYKWTLLAASQGDKDAKETMTILENNMSREQIAEGQKVARNFKPRLAPSAEPDTSSTGIAQTRPQSSGTGFFITEDGYLITNEHVAGSEAQVRLVTREGLISAKVVKVDAANDLALLKAEGKFAALPVAASRTMKLGSTVATVGFPNIGLQGFAPKFARRKIGPLSGSQDDARYFQISAPVQPGNSGGALVDERGNVVGVLSAMLSMKAALATSGAFPQNVSYAVKNSFLLGFLESVPEIAAKLKEPNAKDMKFDDVVEQAKEATALVLVY